MVNGQRHLVDDLAPRVHLYQTAVARLRDHRPAVGEALEGMDFDPAPVARPGFRLETPNDLLGRGNLGDGRPPVGQEDIAAGQLPQVVTLRRIGILPLHLALGVHDGDMALVGSEDAVSRPGLIPLRLRKGSVQQQTSRGSCGGVKELAA